MTHDVFVLSDVGRVRQHNEDDCTVLTDEQVYVVWWRGPTKEQLVGVIPGSAAARGASVRLDLPETTELPAQLLVSLETRPGARPASRGGPVVLEGVLGVPASGSRVPRESEELP